MLVKILKKVGTKATKIRTVTTFETCSSSCLFIFSGGGGFFCVQGILKFIQSTKAIREKTLLREVFEVIQELIDVIHTFILLGFVLCVFLRVIRSCSFRRIPHPTESLQNLPTQYCNQMDYFLRLQTAPEREET